MKHVEKFYAGNMPDVSLIPSLSHRQFRLHLPNGFRKLNRRIRSAQELQQMLVERVPLDVYYSVARWLNPVVVGPHPGDENAFGRYSRNLFLGADIVFDIDVPPLSRRNLAKAQDITKSLVSYLSERYNVSPRYLAFSGGKGFHAVYDDFFDSPAIADPLKREGLARKERKKLANVVIGEGIEIDAPITYDTRRIFRVPGTLNSKTGYMCRYVSSQELDMPVRKILKATPRVSYSPGILNGNDRILWIRCIL